MSSVMGYGFQGQGQLARQWAFNNSKLASARGAARGDLGWHNEFTYGSCH